jgi:hypothetical protein
MTGRTFRRDRYNQLALAFVVINALVWWALYSFARSSLDTYGDMVEAYSWGVNWQWGYDKHPPLSGWTAAAWFDVFPTRDWAYYLLAVVNQGIAFWFIFLAGKRWLSPAAALLTVLLTSLVPLFGPDTGFKFNANSAMLPWVAIFAWSLIVGLQTGRYRYIVMAGIAAGAACLVKYWAPLILISISLGAILITGQHRKLLHPVTMRQFLALAGIGSLVFAPHVGWAVLHHWPGLNYAHASHAIAVGMPAFNATLEVLFDLVLVSLLPMLAWSGAAAWAWRFGSALPTGGLSATVARSRVSIGLAGASIFVVTLVATLISARCAGVAVASKWLIPAWLFFAWFLVNVLPGSLQPEKMIRPVAVMIGLYWFGLGCYVVSIHPEPNATRDAPNQRQSIADEVTREFQHLYGKPLAYVGGNEALSFSTTFYSVEHPVAVARLDFRRTSWVNEADVRQAGLVVLCEDWQHDCVDKAKHLLGDPQSQSVWRGQSDEGQLESVVEMFYAPKSRVLLTQR